MENNILEIQPRVTGKKKKSIPFDMLAARIMRLEALLMLACEALDEVEYWPVELVNWYKANMPESEEMTFQEAINTLSEAQLKALGLVKDE